MTTWDLLTRHSRSVFRKCRLTFGLPSFLPKVFRPVSSPSSVPLHSLNPGYKVGRVDQAETALGAEMRLAADKNNKKKKAVTAEDKGKDKIVRRELNKVYTNGTLVDEALLTDEQAGHCLSIREDLDDEGRHEEECNRRKELRKGFGICVLDSSTSEFNLSAFEDDVCRTKLETIIRQLRPKEILFTKVTCLVLPELTTGLLQPPYS